MGRQVDSDDLVGAAEIAQRLGVNRSQTIHVWRRRYPDFPQPVVHLQQALVFSWAEVEAWASRTGRLPDPGPKG